MEIDLNKRYPLAVGLPILSFISIALCTSPLILHAKNRNLPAAALICWSIVLNLFNIVNALIWPNDNINAWWDGNGLCDIEVNIMVAGYVAVPGCLVSMFRGLAMVMDTSRATWVPNKVQRWRNRAMDLLFCVIVPVISMMTHIVWQKSRYLLYSISGCVNNFDESWVSLALAYIWPPIICLIAGYYCCLVLIRLYKYRSDFVHILRSRGSTMNKSGFLRLFFLAFTLLIAILPAQAYVVYYDLTLSLPWHPYSWNRIHGPGWNQIQKVATYGVVFFDRWTPIAAGFVIFIFFGFGRDATKMYRTMLWYLGFGYCFPGVSRPLDSQASASIPAPNASNSATLIGSASNRAKSFFSKASSSRTGSNSTYDGSYNDIEKGRQLSSQTIRDARKMKTPWYRSFFNRSKPSRRPGEDTLLDDLSVPSQTIHTNAWAGVSQSRASNEYSAAPSSPQTKDFIHVKQVIRQQSEIQL
ncbi:uncharacterized protein N7498_010817 [Penicillium cinerascens]|uniref:Uncharacterized protein n=1 Tax=Penicillium cinerascens TaxID=70096 RepID=A0A9W9J955_9EURO|nr:uncharacterized protein N7498_010817 [Penicillium cinerascens]KAJ5191832.1 hypothetical protein N7498_010817 [Penicillium cinerascens]